LLHKFESGELPWGHSLWPHKSDHKLSPQQQQQKKKNKRNMVLQDKEEKDLHNKNSEERYIVYLWVN
jgi:hypothetical protein